MDRAVAFELQLHVVYLRVLAGADLGERVAEVRAGADRRVHFEDRCAARLFGDDGEARMRRGRSCAGCGQEDQPDRSFGAVVARDAHERTVGREGARQRGEGAVVERFRTREMGFDRGGLAGEHLTVAPERRGGLEARDR